MNEFSRQIRAAEQELDAFAHGGGFLSPTDRMHAILVARADALMGCAENPEDETELAAITDAIEAYEATRWPEGKVVGGKG